MLLYRSLGSGPGVLGLKRGQNFVFKMLVVLVVYFSVVERQIPISDSYLVIVLILLILFISVTDDYLHDIISQSRVEYSN